MRLAVSLSIVAWLFLFGMGITRIANNLDRIADSLEIIASPPEG